LNKGSRTLGNGQLTHVPGQLRTPCSKFDNEDRADVENIKEAFDKYRLGEANVTYERWAYVFHQPIQQPGETTEDFVAYEATQRAVEVIAEITDS